MAPRLSVIIVSDYETGEKSWTDERRILKAFAEQDIAEPFEIVLAENEANRSTVPADLLQIAPRTRIEFFPLKHSWALKDAALPFTSGSIVAVFEADSRPLPGWLRLTVAAMDRHPEVSVVNGRTTYGRSTALRRTLALIDRGYLEVRGTPYTTHVCNNAGLYRRELLEKFPFPPDENPFVNSRLRRSALIKAGYKFLFLPEAESIHEFGGLPFMIDVRRSVAFADGRERFLRAAQSPEKRAELLTLKSRLGYLWQRLKWDLETCQTAHSGHIRWYDWPLTLALLVMFKAAEWTALRRGLAGEPNLPETAYR